MYGSVFALRHVLVLERIRSNMTENLLPWTLTQNNPGKLKVHIEITFA